MEAVRLGIIGAGNIVQSRHLPALKRAGDRFSIVGIMDARGERSAEMASKYGIPNATAYEKYASIEDIPWTKDVDAFLIGTPPHEHEQMCEKALALGKHVLVEKPFVVDLDNGRKLIDFASTNGLIFAVNHNFQYSGAFSKLRALMERNELGEISSFSSVQVSNGDRRLPKWQEELPLGLFYDESPHVLYLMRSFSGSNPVLTNATVIRSKFKPLTPHVLNLDFDCGGIPSSVYINFESPICEWTFSVIGTKQYAVVDLFRDILIVLPTDGQHLMKEVARTSLLATAQHWAGFITNGFKYVQNKLDYGFIETHRRFHDAIQAGDARLLGPIDAELGLMVNYLQHDVIRRA